MCVCVCEAKQADGREMHAVLTAVGELHSLTDWQVSEASEEAELVDFWEREDGVKNSGVVHQMKGGRRRKVRVKEEC